MGWIRRYGGAGGVQRWRLRLVMGEMRSADVGAGRFRCYRLRELHDLLTAHSTIRRAFNGGTGIAWGEH